MGLDQPRCQLFAASMWRQFSGVRVCVFGCVLASERAPPCTVRPGRLMVDALTAAVSLTISNHAAACYFQPVQQATPVAFSSLLVLHHTLPRDQLVRHRQASGACALVDHPPSLALVASPFPLHFSGRRCSTTSASPSSSSR